MSFKLIIDTGTWMKLGKLLHLNVIDERFIDELYNIAQISITPQIERELKQHSVESWRKSKTYVVPVTNEKEYMRAINDEFDDADASIFGIQKKNEHLIITEDRPLLNYGKMYDLDFVFFIDFLTKLLETDLISKNELYSLNEVLYSLRNINKYQHSRTKAFAQHY